MSHSKSLTRRSLEVLCNYWDGSRYLAAPRRNELRFLEQTEILTNPPIVRLIREGSSPLENLFRIANLTPSAAA